MANVQFEEDQQFGGSSSGFQSRQILGVPQTPWMVRLLGKLGVRDEKIAGYILIGIAVVGISITMFLLFGKLAGPTIPPEALKQPGYGLPIKD